MTCSHQPYITCAACGTAAPPPRDDGTTLRRIEYVHERRYIPSPSALDARIDTLVETVRTLACLMEENSRWAAVHSLNTGHEGLAKRYASINRRITDLIADELTWPEDKEPSDAFGEPA